MVEDMGVVGVGRGIKPKCPHGGSPLRHANGIVAKGPDGRQYAGGCEGIVGWVLEIEVVSLSGCRSRNKLIQNVI